MQQIADTVAPERGDVTLDLSVSALGMVENPQGDNGYYSGRQGNRELIGYADLPVVEMRQVQPGEMTFSYATYWSQRLCIAAMACRMSRIADLVVVEVAQMLGDRRALVTITLVALAALELSVVVFAVLFVWPALRWGLRPVSQLRIEIDAEPVDPANFAPLDPKHAPVELTSLITGFNRLLDRSVVDIR